MPSLEVEGMGMLDMEEGKRLVLAIEEDAGVDILHDVGPQLQERKRVSLQGRNHRGGQSAALFGTLKTLPLH